MDRYTQHDRFGHFVPLASAECGEWTLAGKFEKRLYGDAADRLAAYEGTGLTPEEVVALLAQPDNKPLALDELRQMGGEPIWIKEFPPYAFAGYKVLSLRVVDVYGDIVCEDGDIYEYERYGKTWLAYRSKPKEEV